MGASGEQSSPPFAPRAPPKRILRPLLLNGDTLARAEIHGAARLLENVR
jgi:hypothetical protein